MLALTLGVAALTPAACGSTVQQRTSLGAAPGASSDLSNAAPTDSVVGAPGVSASAGGVSIGGPAAVGVARGSNARSISGSTAGTGSGQPVSVGWVVLQSNAAVAGSLGFSSVATPDQTPYAQTMVDWINAHGGLGGRQAKPIYYHMDASGSQSTTEVGQRACASFTQDNHVDVVVDPSIGGGSDQLVQCLNKKALVHVDSTGTLDGDRAYLARVPLFMPAASVADDTLASLEVSALADQGFFAKGSVPGLITYDEKVFHDAVEQVLKPQLKARTAMTLRDDNITYLPAYSQTSDTGPISAAVSSAVLKYSTHGVDRVMFLQNFSLATIVFMRDADSQHYYPRYGLSSNDSPQTDVPLVSAASLKGAIGFGWRPVYDVTADQQFQPGRPGCLRIFAAKQLTFTADASEAAALRHCEGALLLKRGMDASRGTLGSTLAHALETQLGDYQAATVLGVSLSPAHHDGVNIIRNLAYTESCGCFRYTSGPMQLR